MIFATRDQDDESPSPVDPDASLRSGRPTRYSVEAQLTKGDSWPALLVPLPLIP